MSQPLHVITPLGLGDNFLRHFIKTNDLISVVNQIRTYDVLATGGIIHSRQVSGPSGAVEVFRLNFASTGANGYGLGLIGLSNPNSSVGSEWEGNTFAIRINYDNLQLSSPFVGACGATVSVSDFDIVSIGASGSRGDGVFRPLKVFAKDSLPYNIDGSHRFRGEIFFDGSQVVINSSQFHVDDRLIFLASAGNTDAPGSLSGLTINSVLAGGSGSGFVVKGISGDKLFVYKSSDNGNTYYAFTSSEYLETQKGYVSSDGGFKFIGVSGSSPFISLRTIGQDTASIPSGWKIYQSVTGAQVGSLKIKREGITDFDALEMFPSSEVKIGTIANGTGGEGSFRTEATKFSVPSTREKQVLHYSWQNRDLVEIKATADGGMFAEPLSFFKEGTVLTYNNFGQYKRARWDADPFDGYKDSEVIGILEKITSDDFLLQVPVISGAGATYTQSLFSVNENVSIVGNGFTVRGYVYDNLPANGLSGIKVFVDTFPQGITVGSFAATNGLLFQNGGATLQGSSGGDNDLIRVSSTIGITVSPINYGVIVRQGVFEIPTSGATGYSSITSLGLSAGWLFYLGGTFGGNKSNCYGGVTYSPGNLFDPITFYQSGANVAKPVFIYLGLIDGKRMGLFQHYQGLGLTYSITSFETQPVYYDKDTGELKDFSIIGQVAGTNKILNSGFDLWRRLDAAGGTYLGFDSGINNGITFGQTTRQVYPFGTTYDGLASTPFSNTIVSGYIADGYFFDTKNRSRSIIVRRQPISSTLPSMASPPNYELRMMQVTGGNASGRPRLYSIIPDHKTISGSDFNFSFFAKTDSTSTVGITIGTAFVWNAGTTYGIIESRGAFLSSGSGVSGGNFYTLNLTNSYQRYNFIFSAESLTFPGLLGTNSSFVAPFIEMGLTLGDGKSIYITGLQLSKGMSPKPYEKRSVSFEKAECDRYFQNIILGNGGYYPIFTGSSGPKIFTVSNLSVPLAETPNVVTAIDITNVGVVGASASGDIRNLRKDSISVLRDVDTVSTTYHRFFESVYSLDSSGFSGSVAGKLVGMV